MSDDIVTRAKTAATVMRSQVGPHRDGAAALFDELADEIERLRAELRTIAEADPVDLALDPTWAQRIAREAALDLIDGWQHSWEAPDA